MCTLTLVSPEGKSRRLAFNRDELRSRAPGLPPETRRYGNRLAIHPVDSQAGGTWIGGNDAGLVLALMNLNESPLVDRYGTLQPLPFVPPEHPLSRGTLIPSLLHLERIRDLPLAFEKFPLAQTLPFHLFAFQEDRYLTITWNLKTGEMNPLREIEGPLFFTSSGLGDAVVTKYRRPIFDAFFPSGDGAKDNPSSENGDSAFEHTKETNPPAQRIENLIQRQDAFQAHQSPDCPWCSVNMIRPDAKTVSYTTVLIQPDRMTMRYYEAGTSETEHPSHNTQFSEASLKL